MKKRMLTALLCLCMAAALFPMSAFASGDTLAVMKGTDALKSGFPIVYFGNYDNSPLAWYVVGYNWDGAPESDGDTITLLTKGTVGRIQFDTQSNSYKGSNLQSHLEDVVNQFSQKEQAAIAKRDLEDDVGVEEALLWPLSEKEYSKEEYGGLKALLQSVGSTYWGAWWLRTKDTIKNVRVVQMGGVVTAGITNDCYVRPATLLKMDSVLFTSAAKEDESWFVEDGTAIPEIEDYEGNEWKLTLLDSERNTFEVSFSSKDKNIVSVDYTGVDTGENEYLSVIISDKTTGAYTHYGRVLELNAQADGTAKFTLPENIDLENSTIYVFNEQANGDKLTNYASPLREIKVPQFTVTFEMNDHGAEIMPQMVYEGESVEKPADPSDRGCRFEGWYADAALTQEFDFTKPITENTTIYARWTELSLFTVTFETNGHGENTQQTVYDGDKAVAPADPSAVGCRFGGWYADKGCTREFDFDNPITENTTIYAKWTELSLFTVTFEMNGHGAEITQQTVYDGDKAQAPDAAPSAEGWTFEGWYADAALTQGFDFTKPITGTTTVYAKWTENEPDEPDIPADPVETETPSPTERAVPQTGDTSPTLLWAVLLALSAAGIAAGVMLQKRRSR